MKRLFVALGPDWGRHPASLNHIVRVLARTEPVVWINSIAQRAPRLCLADLRRGVAKLWSACQAPTEPATGPLVVHPRVLPYHQYRPVRRINGRLLAAQLQPALDRIQPDFITVVSTNPAGIELIEELDPDVSAYFCMDDYARMRDSDAHLIEVCEHLMLRRADLVFATSEALCTLKARPGRIPIYLPQGVDISHFQTPPPAPAALSALPRPIIGFQGIVGPRVNLDLLAQICARFPQASVVTLGKVEVNLSRLTRYPNFHAFGAVSYEDLPRWISAFDIGLIAYIQDEHTASVNPLKLLEYLAMGMPVVSVELPELAHHKPHVHTALSDTAYLAQLATLIRRFPFPAQEHAARRRYAAQHSWDHRAAQFLQACDARLPQPTKAAVGA